MKSHGNHERNTSRRDLLPRHILFIIFCSISVNCGLGIATPPYEHLLRYEIWITYKSSNSWTSGRTAQQMLRSEIDIFYRSHRYRKHLPWRGSSESAHLIVKNTIITPLFIAFMHNVINIIYDIFWSMLRPSGMGYDDYSNTSIKRFALVARSASDCGNMSGQIFNYVME